MQPQTLKTTWKQRLLAGIIAALLLGSSVAVYVAVVIGNKSASSVDTEAAEELMKKYEEKYAEYQEIYNSYESSVSSLMSEKFNSVTSMKSYVKSYNKNSANEGLKKEDIKIGAGDPITASSTGYGAFYIGWCSDESTFDFSFDDYENPTKLKAPLAVLDTTQLIPGWYQGVDGMKVGGTRIVTIPGELAYGEAREDICDGKNSPLKFIIKTVPLSSESLDLATKMNTMSAEISDLYTKYLYALYGAK